MHRMLIMYCTQHPHQTKRRSHFVTSPWFRRRQQTSLSLRPQTDSRTHQTSHAPIKAAYSRTRNSGRRTWPRAHRCAETPGPGLVASCRARISSSMSPGESARTLSSFMSSRKPIFVLAGGASRRPCHVSAPPVRLKRATIFFCVRLLGPLRRGPALSALLADAAPRLPTHDAPPDDHPADVLRPHHWASAMQGGRISERTIRTLRTIRTRALPPPGRHEGGGGLRGPANYCTFTCTWGA